MFCSMWEYLQEDQQARKVQVHPVEQQRHSQTLRHYKAL